MNKKIKRIIVFFILSILPCIMTVALTVFGIKNNDLSLQLKNAQESLFAYKEECEEILLNAQREYEINALLEMDLANAQEIIHNLKSAEYEFVYLGEYTITHYCVEEWPHICGSGDGLTATGNKVMAWRTAAVDPSIIPYGTKMYIEGYGWLVAEDCGSEVKGRHIDIAVDTHYQAISMGSTVGGVWVLIEIDS